jgi:hypothetical protein
VSFVVPTVPGANPLATPTIDLLATQTVTLSAFRPTAAETEVPATPTPTGWPPEESGCVPEQLFFTSPLYGEQVSGKVVLEGTVDYPNFGFYKYEVKRPEDPIWHTLQASRDTKMDEILGEWDTNLLAYGEYLMRLVAIDNEGQTLGTCEIKIRIAPGTAP